MEAAREFRGRPATTASQNAEHHVLDRHQVEATQRIDKLVVQVQLKQPQ
jgi:hypothetical protein